MNILWSLEQKRSNFAYNLLREVVNLRSKSNLERLNGLLRMVYKEDGINLTQEEFEALRTDKKSEKKEIFDSEFQKSLEEKLSSYISRSPTMILVNGLGNAMAFYISKIGVEPSELLKKIKDFKKKNQKGDKVDYLKKQILEILKPDKIAYLLLYTAINDWLKKDEIGIIKNAKDALEWFRKDETSSIDVLHATKETIELLKWMKRFADAMLEEGTEFES